MSVLGLSRSSDGRRCWHWPQSNHGNSPCRGFAPALARYLVIAGLRPPAAGSLVVVVSAVPRLLSSNAQLSCHPTAVGDLATDGPDEGGELACDGGDRDGLGLALAGERPVAGIEPMLRLPGDLAPRRRSGW